jgi:hypothetical protein
MTPKTDRIKVLIAAYEKAREAFLEECDRDPNATEAEHLMILASQALGNEMGVNQVVLTDQHIYMTDVEKELQYCTGVLDLRCAEIASSRMRAMELMEKYDLDVERMRHGEGGYVVSLNSSGGREITRELPWSRVEAWVDSGRNVQPTMTEVVLEFAKEFGLD